MLAEQESGEINQASYELLGKARELATQVGTKVGAVLVGQSSLKLQNSLISYGTDKVYIMTSKQPNYF